jgi:hypothetical protein
MDRSLFHKMCFLHNHVDGNDKKSCFALDAYKLLNNAHVRNIASFVPTLLKLTNNPFP